MAAKPPSSYRPDTEAPCTKGLWAGVFAAAAVLYLLTCQRGVSWQDSGMFQWRCLTGDYTGRLGLALAHPLYIAAGRALCWMTGNHFAFALNAFSGIGMAVALANLAAAIAVVTGRRWPGLAAAAMLAVAHTVWWLSTVAEVYTWSLAGLMAELWLLVMLIRRPTWPKLTALAFVSGLGLCLHNFALLPLPVYVAVAIWLMARKRLPGWSLATAAGAYLVGAGAYLGQIVELAVRTGDAVGAVRSALVGNYAAAVLNVAPSGRHALANAALTAMNFVSLLAPLAVVGWARFRRVLGGPTAVAVAAVTLIHALFFVRYPVPDQFTFVLPTLALIAFAAGVGLHVLVSRGRKWQRIAVIAAGVSIALPPIFYACAPALARSTGVAVRRQHQLPRDEMRYWLVPWKHDERSAERFAEAALEQAAPDGVIWPDSTSRHPLLLAQRRDGVAAGVTIQGPDGPLPPYADDPAAFREALAGRPLYLVTMTKGYVTAGLLEDAEFTRPPGQILHRLERWGTAQDAPPGDRGAGE